MTKVGWVVLSFYVLTACVLVAITQFDSSFVDVLDLDSDDQRATLQSYCQEWPSDPECLVSSLPALQN